MPPSLRRAYSQPSSPSTSSPRRFTSFFAAEDPPTSPSSSPIQLRTQRRRRAASSSSLPYPNSPSAINSARNAIQQRRARRVLGDIDWWAIVRGQKPDLGLDNLQQAEDELVATPIEEDFEDDRMSNSTLDSQLGYTPSEQDIEDDLESNVSFHSEAQGYTVEVSERYSSVVSFAEQAAVEAFETEENLRPSSPFFPVTLPPLSPLLAQEAAEPSRAYVRARTLSACSTSSDSNPPPPSTAASTPTRRTTFQAHNFIREEWETLDMSRPRLSVFGNDLSLCGTTLNVSSPRENVHSAYPALGESLLLEAFTPQQTPAFPSLSNTPPASSCSALTSLEDILFMAEAPIMIDSSSVLNFR